MKKKLLLVATRQFWPITSGHETVLYYNCKGLHEQYGYEISVFCFADKNIDKTHPLPSFIKEVHYCSVPSKVLAIANMLRYTVCSKDHWPLQNCLYYDAKIADDLKKYHAAVQPDVLVVDMIRLAEYGRSLAGHQGVRILHMEDNLVKRYQRQLDAGRGGSALGYFSKNMGSLANRFMDMKWLKSIILKFEINLLRKYENRISDAFDYYTYVSASETQEFNEIHRTNKAVTVSMGADVEYYAEECAYEKKPRSLSFVGNFAYAPNAESIEFIAKEIMPRLPEDIVMYVGGRCPDDLRKKIESPRVKILGFVDDIRIAVKSTEVFLAPITFGSGVKTKIVEAMAMGMPIVTNHIGAEALNVVSGEEMFICDTVEDIAAKIQYLLDNEQVRCRMGENARQYAVGNHSWTEIYKVFGQMGL